MTAREVVTPSTPDAAIETIAGALNHLSYLISRKGDANIEQSEEILRNATLALDSIVRNVGSVAYTGVRLDEADKAIYMVQR